MKFSVAALALAAGVSATYPASNVTYTTEVLTKYETYCPGPTTITYGTKTYTVSKATTLTITDCPCTVSKPVYTTSAVVCSTCTAKPTTPVVYPTTVPTVYPSGNATVPTVKPTGGVVTSATSATPTTSKPTTIPTAGAAKVGAGLAGLVGLAAALL